ncbi:type 1 glutamine amidotransferase [Luteimonas cellulosilyticus]|uniref:type 1 glutamine amidotransferase n=1 Tax=Luteimonas cellulosilyticus TaxID=2683586 RepID=UPI0013571304|nr:type 1 glutamine amidotransferase [Luteimonas cellulosilyticus]
MSRLLVFQHVAAEPLGTLDPLIRQRGHRIRFVNFEREPEAQPSVDRYRGLVVLGGPMNVEDQHARPHLRTELRAIERMLQQGKPVLGICLGAQLLAHVLGAPVRRIERPEIGWYRLQTTPAGREIPYSHRWATMRGCSSGTAGISRCPTARSISPAPRRASSRPSAGATTPTASSSIWKWTRR